MKKFLCILFSFFIITTNVSAYSKPKSISVTDYAGILSDSSKNYIKSKNEILYSQTQAKIIFVTVENIGNTDIGSYTESLYNEWELYSFGRENSVFFVLDAQNKDYDFIIGENIRLALTDTEIYNYIVSDFEPHFKNEQYEKAVLSLYNAIGKWYESHYNNLNLDIDSNLDKYLLGEKTRDTEKKESNLLMWIGCLLCLTAIIIVLKIRRNVNLRIRKHEREKLKRKYKIDIDKIVNS
ncbi:MAG: TPM domain-containing protein [Clostridia bacterium]|nr:TPM domain-containing protein [Clostridia bacterium]